MTRKSTITKEQVERFRRFKKAGFSLRDIEQEMKVPFSTVAYHLRGYRHEKVNPLAQEGRRVES